MSTLQLPQPKKEKPSALPFQKRRQLEQNLDAVTQQMYLRNKELADTNKLLTLIQTIDGIALEPRSNLHSVCQGITEAIDAATDYQFVGLYAPAHRDSDIMRLLGMTTAGKASENPNDNTVGRPIHLDLNADWFTQVKTSTAIELNDGGIHRLSQLVDSTETEIRKSKEMLNVGSVYMIRLEVRRHTVGVLAIGFRGTPESIEPRDLQLLDRLSQGIGVALDSKLLLEENRRVLRQLKESNAKLMALDEAKDDFVSMASHQLRTPLTSVKGYISMVLEGDAGEINDLQKKLLTQSFFSSQRMVYLIADLLNVSRLKTGKFIIDRGPTNLADVVEQELEQLQDTAKAHNLTLHYTKPKTFTTLLLDETKTRQIIMNFVDNAIYYTPAGGEITVNLVESDTSVELRVVDNGIGVPKTEQAHLFTKFYRAGNARKARPDGTGLGLFMAKKVIVAQGGALIFDSAEGKGSTFGFVFSKAKLSAPSIES